MSQYQESDVEPVVKPPTRPKPIVPQGPERFTWDSRPNMQSGCEKAPESAA